MLSAKSVVGARDGASKEKWLVALAETRSLRSAQLALTYLPARIQPAAVRPTRLSSAAAKG